MNLVTQSCQRKRFEVFVLYQQFRLLDRDMINEISDDIIDENELRIMTGKYTLLITPERDGIVKVAVEIHHAEPPYNPNDWDHIAEASLHLPTGHFQVWHWGDKREDFTVTPGWYRVRTFHGGFNTIDESGRKGNDHYLLVLWPAPPAELRVIKQTTRLLPPYLR
jgi:hypothetical protein